MNKRNLLTILIVGLLPFSPGCFNEDSKKNETENNMKTPIIINNDTSSMISVDDVPNSIMGHFILAESNCAGFNFINKENVLWTNEIACNDPDTLKIRWLDKNTFITKTTIRQNLDCPPGIDIYKVVSFDGKHLTLKSIGTGWNDWKDATLEFTKQIN